MEPFEFRPWYPRGVTHIIAAGATNYIGSVDTGIVLKYPLVPPEEEDVYAAGGIEFRRGLRKAAEESLRVEEQVFRRLGHHPRVIRFIRKHEDGLLIERMPNGSVEHYLRTAATEISLGQRLEWARQASEGLAYLHERHVLHCDISVGNLLLHDDLSIKLCDFQGQLLDTDGSILLSGNAMGSTISSMPRADHTACNEQTDIFALGTAMYIMIEGQPPFPDLDPVEDEHEIQARYMKGAFPPLDARRGGDVVQKCWQGAYASAAEIVTDIQKLIKDYQGLSLMQGANTTIPRGESYERMCHCVVCSQERCLSAFSHVDHVTER
ncbi:hypothetical protein ACN47E_009613 [Coniothyrium glycines]